MHTTITSEIVVAYSQCPRKAFLLLRTDEQGMPHEYMRLLEQQKILNQINYIQALNAHTQTSLEEPSQSVTDLTQEDTILIKATLKTEGLEAYCDVLTQVESSSSLGGSSYEPTLVVAHSGSAKGRGLDS